MTSGVITSVTDGRNPEGLSYGWEPRWTVVLRRQPPHIIEKMLLRLAPMLAELGDGTGAVALLDEARQLHCPASEDTGTNLAGVLRFRQEAAGPTPGCLAVERLTERERTVLQLLQGTQSLGEVSEQLYISVNTLKSHVKTIYRKLGVSRRHDAVTKGRELGLIPQPW